MPSLVELIVIYVILTLIVRFLEALVGERK